MIWIHGGGLQGGSGMDQYTNSTYLTQLDNIVVKINYRLGIMGFMNTFDESKGVPKGGNYEALESLACAVSA